MTMNYLTEDIIEKLNRELPYKSFKFRLSDDGYAVIELVLSDGLDYYSIYISNEAEKWIENWFRKEKPNHHIEWNNTRSCFWVV